MRVDTVVERRSGGSPRRRSLMTTPWWRFGVATASGEMSIARWVATAVLAAVLAIPILSALTHSVHETPAAASAAATAVVNDPDGSDVPRGRDVVDTGRGVSRQQPNAKPAKLAKPKAPAQPKAATVRPVAGLTQNQMNNAAIIVKVAQQRKLPKKAMVVAVATAMQESTLRNLANPSHPASMKMSNQGTGWDFDSLGLFQQRPASGWGSPKEIMDPKYATGAFFDALQSVSGWQSMTLTEAAQTVQGSAFPDAYAKHEWSATQVVNALSR